mmetsp:Transcript_6043/g.24966  ORF Transcript_6043/g.24966 Transcript_6043/m.24966 type:complete len:399 (-) Transcript_6043:152-1348(-)
MCSTTRSHVLQQRRRVREHRRPDDCDQPLKIRDDSRSRQRVPRPQLDATQRGCQPRGQYLAHPRRRLRRDAEGEALRHVSHGHDGVLRRVLQVLSIRVRRVTVRRRLHRAPETREHGFQASDPQVVRHVVDAEQQPEGLEDVESVVVARGRRGSAGAAAGERRADGIRRARADGIRRLRDGCVHQRRLQRRHDPGQRAVAQDLPPRGFDEPAEEVTRASAHLARGVRDASAVQKRRERGSKQRRSSLHRQVVPDADLEQRGRDEPVRRDRGRLRTQDVPRPQEHLHQLAQRRLSPTHHPFTAVAMGKCGQTMNAKRKHKNKQRKENSRALKLRKNGVLKNRAELARVSGAARTGKQARKQLRDARRRERNELDDAAKEAAAAEGRGGADGGGDAVMAD